MRLGPVILSPDLDRGKLREEPHYYEISNGILQLRFRMTQAQGGVRFKIQGALEMVFGIWIAIIALFMRHMV